MGREIFVDLRSPRILPSTMALIFGLVANIKSILEADILFFEKHVSSIMKLLSNAGSNNPFNI